MDATRKLKDMVKLWKDCELCPELCRTRTKVAFGAGNIRSIMIIGEGPGHHEDVVGAPFVGESGKYLNGALEEAGVERKDVYVTNMVLCRPTSEKETPKGIKIVNRPPTSDEMKNCHNRLFEEIYLVDPKIIILLGASAASLVTRSTLEKSAGELFYLEVPGMFENNVLRYPTIVTYHPAFMLRGSTHRAPGTPAQKFFEHINYAVESAIVAKELSKELIT